MSKPYFTKYLAVPGKLKEGERGISINNAIYTHYAHLGDDYGKPMKLFLCSRDVQVGDEVTCIDPSSINFGKKAKHFEFGDTVNWVNVIGEISPEATWVTEGMEFDENELQVFVWDGYEENHEEFMTFNKEKYEETQRFQFGDDDSYFLIQVKGPCGHFH
jgi:hypothetical protein